MESYIKDALDPKNEGKPPIPLHQVLIYRLYDYLSTLWPPTQNIMLVQLPFLTSHSLTTFATGFTPLRFFQLSNELFSSPTMPSSSITITKLSTPTCPPPSSGLDKKHSGSKGKGKTGKRKRIIIDNSSSGESEEEYLVDDIVGRWRSHKVDFKGSIEKRGETHTNTVQEDLDEGDEGEIEKRPHKRSEYRCQH